MSGSTYQRLLLIGVAGVIAIVGFLLIERQNTVFPRTHYWRSHGVLITRDLLGQPLTNHSNLLRWAESSKRDIASPLLMGTLSELLNRPIREVFWYPVIPVVLMTGQAAVANGIYRHRLAFPIALVLASGFRFTQTHLLESITRPALGWALFFWILYICLRMIRTTKSRRVRWYLLFIIVFPIFILSYSTLSVSFLAFWITFVLLVNFQSTVKGKVPLILIVIGVFSYFILIVPWLAQVISVFALRISGEVATFAELYPELVYQNQPPPLYYALGILARFLAVSLVLGTVGLQLRKQVSSSSSLAIFFSQRFSILDIFLIASAVQGVAGYIVGSFYPISGGLDPLLFGLLITPVAGVAVVQRLQCTIVNINPTPPNRRTIVSVLLVVCLVGPGFAVFAWETTDQQRISYSYTQADRAAIEWASSDQVEGRVSSDFNTISAMYYMDSSPYQPTNVMDIFEFKEYFYDEPTAANAGGDIVLVTSVIIEDYVYNLGSSTTTVPNPGFISTLEQSRDYDKVYTADTNTTIFDVSS